VKSMATQSGARLSVRSDKISRAAPHREPLWLCELALVLVRFDHIASRIVNADQSIM